jgi:hypothetical protein
VPYERARTDRAPTTQGSAVARYAPLITLGMVTALGGGLLLVNTTVGGSPATTAGTPVAAPPAAQPAVPPAVGQVVPTEPGSPAAPPAAPPADAEAAYTGRSAGNEVTVAIAVKDGRAVGYVCDGEEVEAWLEGTVTGSGLQLSGAGGANLLTATATEKAVLGTVTVAGEERPFAAEGVEAPAGLYEGNATVRGVLTRVGWIVDGEGDVTGVVNAGGVRRPAPELDPADPTAATIDGVPVTVTPLDGGDRVIRR